MRGGVRPIEADGSSPEAATPVLGAIPTIAATARSHVVNRNVAMDA